jgi:hypothetical protein
VGGRRPNLDRQADLDGLVEVSSCWGTFEALFHEALQRGYRAGVIASGAGWRGRPGAEHAGASLYAKRGGLTCILAESCARTSLFAALKERRTYATSGARILIDASLADRPIGAAITTSERSLALNVRVCGTAGIEQIALLAAGRPLTIWPASPYTRRSPKRLRIRWSGARGLGRHRGVSWNGFLKLRDNTVTGVEGFAFDSSAEGIEDWGPTHVRWTSMTNGDEDGLILQLERESEGTLTFEGGVIRQTVALEDLATRPMTFQSPGADQKVVMELAPVPNLKADVTWSVVVTPRPGDGVMPYHLRVTQVDGQLAWTSPWFVTALR